MCLCCCCSQPGPSPGHAAGPPWGAKSGRRRPPPFLGELQEAAPLGSAAYREVTGHHLLINQCLPVGTESRRYGPAMIDQADSPAARGSGAAASPLLALLLRARLREVEPPACLLLLLRKYIPIEEKKFQSDFSVFSFLPCLALVIISTESC